MSMIGFFNQMLGNPMLMISTLLTLGVILVNGWTDAPNAIATCVSTKAIGVRKAIIMAAVFNFLGVFVMTSINASVAFTIYNMVDFGGDSHLALIALCAAMAAIVIWATAAWYFGIPTSESHALIAGISGAAVAIQNSFSGINGAEWVKVIYGIFLSTLLGFGLGFVTSKLTVFLFRNQNRLKTERFFSGAQVAGGAAMAFMHGAQDGLKFMGIIMLAFKLSGGVISENKVDLWWMMLLCSLIMAGGTAIGGKKIIKSVGMDMVKLEKYQGFSADIASALALAFCSFTGLPVSTTHAKTISIMGVGAVRNIKAINFGVVKEMCLTWILTFPGCALVGYIVTKVFLWVSSLIG